MMAAQIFRRTEFSVLLFAACLGCVDVPEKDVAEMPPNAAARVCAKAESIRESASYVTPTRRLAEVEIPVLYDDLDLQDMEIVLMRQLEQFKRETLDGTIQFGQDKFPLKRVPDSLRVFQQLVHDARSCLSGGLPRERCLGDFRKSVKEKFAFYAPKLEPSDPRFGEERSTLFTGYYTPSLEVSLKREGPFQHPIFTKPADDWVSRMGRFEIDFREGLAGRNLEMFYAKERFDLYLLHLEGGGRVFFKDAKGVPQSIYLSYGGSNGRKWRFIVVKMLENNWVTDSSIPYQREFLQKNPQREEEVFSYCPSYVYFRTTETPPEGSRQVPLTDNRSIATDYNYYGFKGVLSFIKTERPRSLDKDVEMMPFSRFVLDQDTGSAIKGKARVDFYLGEGAYAELAANTMKERGDLYFLMLKP